MDDDFYSDMAFYNWDKSPNMTGNCKPFCVPFGFLSTCVFAALCFSALHWSRNPWFPTAFCPPLHVSLFFALKISLAHTHFPLLFPVCAIYYTEVWPFGLKVVWLDAREAMRSDGLAGCWQLVPEWSSCR